jgi:hypothetical protein
MPKRLRRGLSSTTSRSALHRHWTAQNRKAWDAMRAQARAADPEAATELPVDAVERAIVVPRRRP